MHQKTFVHKNAPENGDGISNFCTGAYFGSKIEVARKFVGKFRQKSLFSEAGLLKKAHTDL
jgi:hypothetical protein